MSKSSFKSTFDDLPEVLPIFPLTGVLLLPTSRLPLNIFEPRYLQMVQWALGHGRLIGMIQPKGSVSSNGEDVPADLYQTGCAGRIISFQETDDGRFLIVLEGVSRFHVKQEEPTQDGFRLVTPDWSPFRSDLSPAEDTANREALVECVPKFFECKGITADWELIKAADDRHLVNTLALFCPFDPSEKQALLEAANIGERADLLITMMEMAMQERDDQSRSKH